MNKCIFIVIMILYFGPSYAQEVSDSTKVNPEKKIPSDSLGQLYAGGQGSISDFYRKDVLIPPSPSSVSLAKFIDVPVSYYSGTHQLSIPLFKVQEKELEVDVSLSYHASGLKVDDYPGWVGTNWSISTGGIVTRTLRGRPDESRDGYFSNYSQVQTMATNASTLDLNQYYDVVKLYENGEMDSQADVFFFSFANYSGKLYIVPGVGAITVPFQKLKVQVLYDYGYQNSAITGFVFTTPDGTTYDFGHSESNTTTIPNGGSLDPYNSSWFLSSIQSKDGHLISFQYSEHMIGYENSTTTRHDILFPETRCPSCPGNSTNENYSRTSIFNAKKVHKITFSNGYLEFFATQNREDTNSDFIDSKLNRIELHDASGALVKGYNLFYGYFLTAGGGKRLKLQSVSEFDKNQIAQPGHVFTYEENNVPSLKSKSQDKWGYHNGKYNDVLYPAMASGSPYFPILDGANREVDPLYLKGGVLNSIAYPTGGVSYFEYEAHSALVENTITAIGGLRIKKITHKDPVANKSFSKSFIYGVGTTTYRPRFDYIQKIHQQVIDCLTGDITWWGDYMVCEYMVRSSGNQVTLGSGEHVVYTQVTQLDSTNYQNGRTEYFFTYVPNNGGGAYPFAPPTEYNWMSGLLREKKIYSTSGNLLLKETSSFHNPVQNGYLFKGFKIGKNIQWASGHLMGPDNNVNYATIEPYNIVTGWQYLSKTEQYEYDPSDSTKFVKSTQEFFYGNPTHAQLTRQTSINSKGQVLKTSFRYPHDFASTAPYGEMINRFIISPVIERYDSLETIPTRYRKTTYELRHNLLLPVRSQSKIGTGPLQEDVIILAHDTRGNPTQVQEKDGSITQFSWYSAAGKKDLLQAHTEAYGTTLAQTTSYDYKPMVGMETLTDADGKKLYFEYDGLGRLKAIRDTDASGAIRASYCYNYAGQAMNCDAVTPTGIVQASELHLLGSEDALPVNLTPTMALNGSPTLNMFESRTLTLRIENIGQGVSQGGVSFTVPRPSSTTGLRLFVTNAPDWNVTANEGYYLFTLKPGLAIPGGGFRQATLTLQRESGSPGTYQFHTTILNGSGGRPITPTTSRSSRLPNLNLDFS